MNINEYLSATWKLTHYGMLEKRDRIICADGFSMSVQASEMHYCSPRSNHGPYTCVELGYPSKAEPLIMEYAETADDPTGTVYGCVPVEIVDEVIKKHGGMSPQEATCQ